MTPAHASRRQIVVAIGRLVVLLAAGSSSRGPDLQRHPNRPSGRRPTGAIGPAPVTFEPSEDASPQP